MQQTKVRAPKGTAKQEKRANGQGSIYFDRKKNRYVVAVPDYTKPNKRRKKFFRTKKEAENFLYEYITNKGLGKASFSANPKIKVSEFLASWHSNFKAEPETCRSYDTAIRNWINPFLGNLRVEDLTPSIIEGLYKTLDNSGYSGSALHITHTVFSSSFKNATRLGLIAHNPMTNVKKLKKHSITSKHIPKNDADRIYAEAAKDPYLHARVELGMVKGIRPGELLGSTWSDIDWERRTITIERQLQRQKGEGLVFKGLKNHQSRVLPLSDEQVAILQVHQFALLTSKVFWNKSSEKYDLIFPNKNGMPKDSKADHRDWKKLLEDTGLCNRYTRYQMRKTAITNHITHGVDEKTTAVIAGHASPSVTMKHYANATTASMLAALSVEDSCRPNVDLINSINSNSN